MKRLTEGQNRRIAEKLKLRIVAHGFFQAPDGVAHCREFDSWAGFRLIIEHGPKQEWWDEFVTQSDAFIFLADIKLREWAVKSTFIGPRLAHVLDEFFGKE